MSDLILPGVNGKTETVRPFRQLGKKIKAMGFDTALAHDAPTRTVRVRFTPRTARARQMLVAAAAHPDAKEGFETAAEYAQGDSPAEKMLECIELGIKNIEAMS